MIKCWYVEEIHISINLSILFIGILISRHPDPRSRPQFGHITKLLAGNGNYLLGWSDEDKQVAGEDGMKLGAPLECTFNLYYDLQCQYKQV